MKDTKCSLFPSIKKCSGQQNAREQALLFPSEHMKPKPYRSSIGSPSPHLSICLAYRQWCEYTVERGTAGGTLLHNTL